jgi:hypothetical protein
MRDGCYKKDDRIVVIFSVHDELNGTKMWILQQVNSIEEQEASCEQSFRCTRVMYKQYQDHWITKLHPKWTKRRMTIHG